MGCTDSRVGRVAITLFVGERIVKPYTCGSLKVSSIASGNNPIGISKTAVLDIVHGTSTNKTVCQSNG